MPRTAPVAPRVEPAGPNGEQYRRHWEQLAGQWTPADVIGFAARIDQVLDLLPGAPGQFADELVIDARAALTALFESTTGLAATAALPGRRLPETQGTVNVETTKL